MNDLLRFIAPGPLAAGALLALVATTLASTLVLLGLRTVGRAASPAVRRQVALTLLAASLALPAAIVAARAAQLRWIDLPRSMLDFTPVTPSLAPPREQSLTSAPRATALPPAIASPTASAPTSTPAVEPPSAVPVAPARVQGAFPIALEPKRPGPAKSAFLVPVAPRLSLFLVAGLFVWFAGIVVLAIRLAVRLVALLRLRRSATALVDTAATADLRQVARRLGLRRVPALLESPATAVPVALGLLRPAIILPRGHLARLAADQRRDLFVHESAHLLHGDPLGLLVQALATTLFWPVIPLHAVARELQRAREDLCDNHVLAERRPADYAATLLRIAELARGVGNPLALSITGAGELERRVRALLDPSRDRRTTSARGVRFVSVVTAVLFALAIAGIGPPGAEARNPAPARADFPDPLTFDPDAPENVARYFGRVVDEQGRPLAGAEVRLLKTEADTAGPVRARTDEAGRFDFQAPDMTYAAFDGLPAREPGLLVATSPGRGPDWFRAWGRTNSSFRSHHDPVRGAGVELRLPPDDVPIHGTLTGPDGAPLRGARVRVAWLASPRNHDLDQELRLRRENSLGWAFLSPEFGHETHHPERLPGLTTATTTDASGQFQLSGFGRDQLLRLEVRHPAIVDTDLSVMTRQTEPAGELLPARFTARLKPGRTIHGVVRERGTGLPLAGIMVGPQQNALSGFNAELYPYLTDAEGRFTIHGRDLVNDDETIVAVASPGLPYETAWTKVLGPEPLVIELERRIPFHLLVRDDAGAPIDAEVTYVDVQVRLGVRHEEAHWPVGRARRNPDGSYTGFVRPGPGAVLVRAREHSRYQPAHVDPRAFFGPAWPAEAPTDELPTAEGIYRDVIYRGGGIRPADYDAVVLVNPPSDSAPLDLQATLVRDRPLTIRLSDEQGRPVTGAEIFESGYGGDPPLRGDQMVVRRLDPARPRFLTFTHDEQRRIAVVEARAGVDSVRAEMRPWAELTGRFVDEQGRPVTLSDHHGYGPRLVFERGALYDVSKHELLPDGRFRITRIPPGDPVHCRQWSHHERGPLGPIFARLVLAPGEVRDLGDIVLRPLVAAAPPEPRPCVEIRLPRNSLVGRILLPIFETPAATPDAHALTANTGPSP